MSDILLNEKNPANLRVVLPGKRSIVFIRKLLSERQYSGLMPNFCTIEDLILEISGKIPVEGISLWLFAYLIYQKQNPSEDFESFIKWYPTLQKDWDDILKFAESDTAVLSYMLDEERIREWSENLGEQNDVPRKRFLNFWRKMNDFLPALKQNLAEKNWATSGMLHETAKQKVVSFCENTEYRYAFCGFNAFTPVEEILVKQLLQRDKARCYFQADEYYLSDTKQEAGKFLRTIKTWKEFNESRVFQWVEADFVQPKTIRTYEVSGNITQTKVLPELFKTMGEDEISETALVLLDENLLPATLDALQSVPFINITMGFPVKNLAFSNAVKQVFHLQKQLEKSSSSYYYKDVLSIVEDLPQSENDLATVQDFRNFIEERNIVYISKKLIYEKLEKLDYFYLLEKAGSQDVFLNDLIRFCAGAKEYEMTDIQYETISLFETTFRILKNQLESFEIPLNMETMEQLINQHINSETIDFQGEPLQGLQVMGLLETRLLNFKTIILLSVNEGKLPLGNVQNTYLPFNVRANFGMHTFLENDSIYAYHFYRLIQDSSNVHLLYNALSSGVNTGEKSRFITQMEIESPHKIQHFIVENATEPIPQNPVTIEKTPEVLERLELWKSRVSTSHLISYLYNPVEFYLSKILQTYESQEIEEELSVRNYGTLVHYGLQFIYEELSGRILTPNDFSEALNKIDLSIEKAIETMNHQPAFYEKGMNYVHKTIAKRVITSVLNYDLQCVMNGDSLEILALEKRFENVDFPLDDNGDKVSFYGFIDRIDRLNGTIRVIDYKTAKTKDLKIKIDEKNLDDYFFREGRKQALQLSVYQYAVASLPEFKNKIIETGIWSFAEVTKGAVMLHYEKGSPEEAMVSVKNLIKEILNPEIPFSDNSEKSNLL